MMLLGLFPEMREAQDRFALQNAAPDLPIGFGEAFSTAINTRAKFSGSLAEGSNRYNVYQDVLDKFEAATGEALPNPEVGNTPVILRHLRERFEARRADIGDLRLPEEPDIAAGAVQAAREARSRDIAARGRARGTGATAGFFLGDTTAAVSDPVNIIGMGLGAPAAAGIVRTAVMEAFAAAASEAAIQGLTYDFKKEVDPTFGLGEAAGEVGIAAIGGGVLGGGIKGLATAWRALRGGDVPRHVRDAGNVVESEAQVAETNPFPDAAGEANHARALAKAVEDVTRGRPVDVSDAVGQDVARSGLGQSVEQRAAPAPASPEDVRAFREAAPERDLDTLYQALPRHQVALEDVGREIEATLGVTFKTPGMKKRETAAEKMARKGYDSTRKMTDLVRGGFVTQAPEDADRVVAELAKHFDVLDEGWTVNQVGYVDRKALVRFDDGSIGEIQLWEPNLLRAKDELGGSKLYTERRSLPVGDPRRGDLLDQEKALYSAAAEKAGASWKGVGSGGSSPNIFVRASRETTPPLSSSAELTSVQSSPGARTANPLTPSETAGRHSQLMNVSGRPIGDSVRPDQALRPDEVAGGGPLGTTAARALDDLTPEQLLDAAATPEAADALTHRAENMQAAEPRPISVTRVADDGTTSVETRDYHEMMREIDDEIRAADELKACVIGDEPGDAT
jgi:hypothetical protein